MKTIEQINTDLVSYCGFYCGACPTFIKGKCKGCKGDNPNCAVGYKSCKVRPCCIDNEYANCADCKKYDSVKDCSIYNSFMIKFGQFITQTNRRKGIEMIKEKGEVEFVSFMSDKNWVTMKNKNK